MGFDALAEHTQSCGTTHPVGNSTLAPPQLDCVVSNPIWAVEGSLPQPKMDFNLPDRKATALDALETNFAAELSIGLTRCYAC